MLDAVNIVFADATNFSGPCDGIVAFFALIFGILIAEFIVSKIYFTAFIQAQPYSSNLLIERVEPQVLNLSVTTFRQQVAFTLASNYHITEAVLNFTKMPFNGGYLLVDTKVTIKGERSGGDYRSVSQGKSLLILTS